SAFISADRYDIAQNGLHGENGLALAADGAGLAVPVVTGGGAIIRTALHAADAVDALTTADKAADAVKTTTPTTKQTPTHAPCKNSFSAATPVATPDGGVPIADIDVGDTVLAYHDLALPNCEMHLDRADPRRQHPDHHARPLLLRVVVWLAPPPGRHAVGRPPGQPHPRDNAGQHRAVPRQDLAALLSRPLRRPPAGALYLAGPDRPGQRQRQYGRGGAQCADGGFPRTLVRGADQG
ncbi:MAG: hypothetical protein MI924_28525, partial [Chloroflexales bacterium]|nr:hypothetical protein [Chloroflexales bacterium]